MIFVALRYCQPAIAEKKYLWWTVASVLGPPYPLFRRDVANWRSVPLRGCSTSLRDSDRMEKRKAYYE